MVLNLSRNQKNMMLEMWMMLQTKFSIIIRSTGGSSHSPQTQDQMGPSYPPPAVLSSSMPQNIWPYLSVVTTLLVNDCIVYT